LEFIRIVMGTKTTISIGFLNQDKNKSKLHSKFRSWNKKNKNKNMIHAKPKFNKILLQGKYKNRTRLWQENVSKLVLNILKVTWNYISNYTYWTPSFWRILSRNFQLTRGPCSPMCAHVHPCVPICELRIN
jgi:hypothetical protein